jgi:hypothetical protein
MSQESKLTSPAAVRAVIEQWRKEAVVIDAQANSNQQFSVRTMELLDVEASIRRQCADELEAALTAPELELECEIHPMMRKADCPCGAVSEVPEQARRHFVAGWTACEYMTSTMTAEDAFDEYVEFIKRAEALKPAVCAACDGTGVETDENGIMRDDVCPECQAPPPAEVPEQAKQPMTNDEAMKLTGRVLTVGGLPFTVISASTYGDVRVFDPSRNVHLVFDSRETFENWAHGTPVPAAAPPPAEESR